MQESVALFASELLRLKAQIICSKFQPETILRLAAAEQMSQADQQMIPQALQLMKDKPLRSFRIQVAADSLVQLDENQNKQDRMEFMTAFSNLMREMVPATQQVPELTPMLMEVVKYAVGGFKQAQVIEGTIDLVAKQLESKAANAAQNPQPNPEMIKAQALQQSAQMKVQADTQSQQARAQADMQIEHMKMQMEAQLETQRQQHDAQFKMQELAAKEQFDRWKTELDAATKIMVARISANPGMDIPMIEAQQAAADTITKELGDNVRIAMDQMTNAQNNMANMHGESMQKLHAVLQAANAPKRIIRGADGRAMGVEPMQPPQGMVQ